MASLENIGFLVLGFVTGFFSASLGIGGGVILVPTLFLLFKDEIKRAIGTSLAVVAAVAFFGATAHYVVRSNNIRFIIALFIIMGSIVGAILGTKLANKLSGKLLGKMFALLLLLVGLKMAGVVNIPTETVLSTVLYPFLVILGLVIGVASALFGIGGGIVMVPALNLFFGLSMHQAVATSLIVIFPTALVGTVFHNKFNNLNLKAIKFLVPLSLVGAVLGAVVSNKLPTDTLKVIFGIFMIFLSIKIFLRLNSRERI